MISQAGLSISFLITPQTPEARIRKVDELSQGFVYMVADSSITGAKSGIADRQLAYFERVDKLGLKNPRLIGFGISNRETFELACRYASGAIIGRGGPDAAAGAAAFELVVDAVIGERRVSNTPVTGASTIARTVDGTASTGTGRLMRNPWARSQPSSPRARS